jgi:hypothetical protein
MMFTLRGDASPKNIDMIAVQALLIELQTPGLGGYLAAQLAIHAMCRTGMDQHYIVFGQGKHLLRDLGPFTLQKMTDVTPEREIGEFGLHITRPWEARVPGHNISASLQQAMAKKREWENQRAGPLSKRARSSANNQDHASDKMDIDDEVETGTGTDSD